MRGRVTGTPPGLQAAGDLYRIGITDALTVGATIFTRVLTQDVHDPVAASFTLGGQLPVPVITNDAGNYARPHVVFTLPAEYDQPVTVKLSSAFVFPLFSSSSIAFLVSKDWLGGTSVDLTTASFSGMPGWDDSWPPASLAGGSYVVTGAGSATTAAACVEGRKQSSASVSATLP